jgi:diaminopimelate decarboxylase
VGQGVLTAGYARRDGVLHGDDVSLEQIAERAGTPTFVYSLNVVRDRVQRLRTALAGVPHTIHYALKANANRAIIAELRALGCGVDVVSGGELFRAQRAGFAGSEILFGGVGKTRAELEQALDAKVKLINVESEAELRALAEIARAKGVVAPVGLRINPEVDVANAHHYMATGAKGHKFGIGHGDALRVGRLAISLKSVSLVAVDMHVGSQLHSFAAYRDGTARQIELVRALRKDGAPIKWLDVGGGLPVPYQDEPEPDLDAYAKILRETANALGDVEILLEHGRFLVAASGALLTRVLYRKESGGKTYLVCDAGMTELLRPSHYDAFHRIEPVREGGVPIVADIVGPVCESGDFLALDRSMADVAPGAVLAVHTAGAYGFVMASHYNARPRAAEVVVDGSRWAVVTARESYEDLVRLEASAPRWEEAR